MVNSKLDWDRIKKWDYIVVAVSAEYHKKYEMVELEDIKQSLYQWFVEHPNKLNEWESIGEKDAKNLIYRSLRNDALDYCQKWKAKSLGYETSDVFFYEADIVEALLPAVLRGETGISHKLNLVGPVKPPAPAEGGNLMVMMIGIEKAYLKLSPEDMDILFYRHADSMDYNDIATEMDINSGDAVRMRHNRAIKKLINRIGGFRTWSDKDIDSKSDDTKDENESVPPDESSEDRSIEREEEI